MNERVSDQSIIRSHHSELHCVRQKVTH